LSIEESGNVRVKFLGLFYRGKLEKGMSAPPPGYNAGDSLLQSQVQAHGGTASIVPVMGGGRLRGALKKIRKKHTRRGGSKKKGKTKKTKKGGLSQRGGRNHYSLATVDDRNKNDVSAKVTNIVLPTYADKDILERHSASDEDEKMNSLKSYLIQQNKLWVRSLRETLFKNASLKSNVPNLNNIGCFINRSDEGLYTKRFLHLYSPDRLCCVLPKEITSIRVLPAVNGNISKFNLVLTGIKNSMNNNSVFIFSPPFFGEILKENVEVFYAFLKYKTEGLTKGDLFYILTDYSLMNIETIRWVSKEMYEKIKEKPPIEELQKGDKRFVGESIITALYGLLEPTYIIYPYAISFPVTTLDSVVKDVRQEQDKKTLLTVKGQYEDAKKIVTNIKRDFKTKEKSLPVLRSEAFQARQVYDTNLAKEIDKLISAYRLSLVSNPKQPSPAQKEAAEKNIQQQVTQHFPTTDIDSKNEQIQKTESEMKRLQEDLKKEEMNLQAKSKIYIEAKDKFEDNNTLLINSPGEIEEQRGGILFSAANKEEPILPAPYSGFQGPIQYIQTNDANTARGSIAYRVDLAKKEPSLDTMNYKEYNLLLRPPMNSNSMYEFYFKNKPIEQPSIDGASKMFMPSTEASHMRVPGTPISVGLKEFVVRNPLPDVVADWKNAIYSQDESDYLNAMKLNPEILNAVFQDKWKEEVSNHLSMITRSNCFKDTRLILHSECQDAQKFISKVMKYYMENSESILKLRRQQDTDYMMRLQSALDSKMDGKHARTSESIFTHMEFVRAFYAPKPIEGKINTAFLLSVTPIIVSKVGKEFTVKYDEKWIEESMRTAIQRAVMGPKYKNGNPLPEDLPTLTIEDDRWKFDMDVNVYNLTRTARIQLPSFNIIDMTPSDNTKVTTEVYVCYFGDLENYDRTLINKTTGVDIQENLARGDGLRKFILKNPVNLTDYGKRLDTIANTNINDFRFEKNEQFKYEDVNYTEAKIDMTARKAILTILMRDKSDPTKDIAADLSMNLDSGVSKSQTNTILQKEFARISKEVNSGKVFGGRYILSEGNME